MKTLSLISISILLIFLFNSCDNECDIEEPTTPYSYLDNADFITDGLIAYYPFNGDTKDYSGNSNDAFASGTTFGNDRFNESFSAVSLDGIDDYLMIPNFGNLMVDGEGTIIIWSKIATPYMEYYEPKSVVLSIVDSINTCFVLGSRLGYFVYSIGNYPGLGGGSLSSSVSIEDFNLFVISFTDSSITIYDYSMSYYDDYYSMSYDKETRSNPKYSFGFGNDRKNQDLYLGKSVVDSFDSDGFDNFFTYYKGEIDDLLLYNRILSDEEIKYLFDLK
jgi:hypothetical protein